MTTTGIRMRVRSSLFWALLSRQRRWVRWLIGLFVFSAVVNIAISNLIRAMVDQGIVDQTRPLGAFVSRIAAMGCLGLVVSFATQQVLKRISYQIEFDLRVWLYTRIQSAELGRLRTVTSGQVVTRALTDLRVLEQVLAAVPLVIGMLPVLLGMELLLLRLSWQMALLAPIGLPVNLWLLARVRTRLGALSWADLNERAEVANAVDEPVRGIRVVKAFGREADERSKVATVTLGAYRFGISRARLLARVDLLMKIVPFAIQAGVVAVGARLVASGSLTLGTFLISFTLTSFVAGFSSTFDDLASSWQYLRSAQVRLTEVLALGSLPPAGGRPLPEHRTGLKLRGVSVDFDGCTVLDHLDLHVAPGEMVVVQGPPGSGKSTLAATAVGLLGPSAGAVVLDGLPLAELDPNAVRGAARVVSEESVLFATTVRGNLALGAGGHAAKEAIAAALHATCADDIVAALPHGLDAEIGDRGLTLSGGQRQRLALARALVVPPRVLVLDDAMAAVNPALEMEILRRIRALVPSLAIICITRRPDPVALADRVVELPAPVGEPVPASEPGEPTNQLAALAPTLAIAAARPGVSEADVRDDQPPSPRRLARPFWLVIVLGLLALLVQSITQLSPQYLFGRISDVVDDGDLAAVDRRALAMAGLAVVYGLSSYAFRVLVARVVQGVVYVLRRRVFQRLTALGVDFYDHEKPGEVATRVVNDLDTILTFLERSAFRVLTAGFQFVVAMAVITVLSPAVGPLALGLAAVVAVVTLIQVPIGMRAFGWARDELGDVTAKFEEDFNAREEIRNLGAQTVQTQHFVTLSWRRRRSRWWAAMVTNSYAAIIQFIGTLSTALILWRSGESVLSGEITIGTALTLQLLVSTATSPLQTIGAAVTEFLEARVSWRRLLIPYEAPVLPAAGPSRLCERIEGDITFEHISFAYPRTHHTVLHGVSFVCPSQKITAIVGYTGAGKSSVAKLLQRMYDPTIGAVQVGGTDIRAFDLASYRGRLGVVPQDAFLFRGSVRSNLAYGRPDATDAEIGAALRAVGGGQLLDGLAGGLDHPVDAEGRNLTAAQRQLIALGRAWLVRPDVLVLDEATSCLDAPTEDRVLDALESLGTTIVTVTHRERVAERADVIVVLDDGDVVDSGRRDELVGSGRPYHRLWTTHPATERSTS